MIEKWIKFEGERKYHIIDKIIPSANTIAPEYPFPSDLEYYTRCSLIFFDIRSYKSTTSPAFEDRCKTCQRIRTRKAKS